jgi:outer membrane protein assembly factor BamB
MWIIAAALALTLALAPQTPPAAQQPAPAPTAITEELWNAARAGDVARVTKALEGGADIQGKTRYGATALTFAADKGHLEVVKLLLDRGADPNAQDTFYRMRALDMALMNNHNGVAALLLERGSKGAGAALMSAVQDGNVAIAKAALASPDITSTNLNAALGAATRSGNAEIIALIEKKRASMPADTAGPAVVIDRSVLQSYVGSYRNDVSGLTLMIALDGNQLTSARPGQPPLTLVPTSQTTFTLVEIEGLTLAFAGRGGLAESLVLTQNNSSQTLQRVAATSPAGPGAPAPAAGDPGARSGRAAAEVPPTTEKPVEAAPAKPVVRTAPRPWPAFRGDNASGNGDGQGAVTEWNVADGRNVRWTTPIPGIANASPIVWGNRVFVVTAISSAGDKTFRTGLYGDVAPVNDLSEHSWKIYCLDKSNGKILWEQTAFTGLPKVKRHPKASQANSTPVTDGTRVVALFGSIGMLAAWDMNGKPLWKVDVGVLDSGWFFDPTYQWGHSSSPIIYKGTAIVQADVQKRSFIAAYDLKTGKQVWRTDRDEIPTWGTPTVFGEQVVTNGPKIRGYDAASGKLLWTLGPNSEVAVGTPVVGDGLVYVTGGYPPARPIYAVKPTAVGDISLPKDTTSSDAIAWSNTNGTYIPTPIYYDGLLYTCSNDGVLTAYDAKSGERVYRARVGGGGSFAASPIAADGRLYFANEDGDVIVARAGRKYEELAKNQMKEVIMSTPAISDGLIIVRTIGHVYGIGESLIPNP